MSVAVYSSVSTGTGCSSTKRHHTRGISYPVVAAAVSSDPNPLVVTKGISSAGGSTSDLFSSILINKCSAVQGTCNNFKSNNNNCWGLAGIEELLAGKRKTLSIENQIKADLFRKY